MIETKPLCASSSNLADMLSHASHSERMSSIDFGGYMSKGKVTIGIIDKCGVRSDASLCVIFFFRVR